MSIKANTLRVSVGMAWEQEQTNAGGTFAVTRQGPDSNSFSTSPNTTTYNEILLTKLSIASAGSNTVDFYSYTSLFNNTVTATKLLGYMVRANAAATGGLLTIAPGGTNPLNWPFTTNTMNCTYDVGTAGCVILHMNGTTVTLSNTSRNVTFSNGGNQTVTAVLSAIVGT